MVLGLDNRDIDLGKWENGVDRWVYGEQIRALLLRKDRLD